MISLRRRKVEPEREKLPEDVKKWYAELVTLENPLSAFYPDFHFEPERKARFFVLQCPHCKGIHAGACPAVRRIEHYENGNIKSVVFAESYDDAGIILFEDVFGD